MEDKISRRRKRRIAGRTVDFQIYEENAHALSLLSENQHGKLCHDEAVGNDDFEEVLEEIQKTGTDSLDVNDTILLEPLVATRIQSFSEKSSVAECVTAGPSSLSAAENVENNSVQSYSSQDQILEEPTHTEDLSAVSDSDGAELCEDEVLGEVIPPSDIPSNFLLSSSNVAPEVWQLITGGEREQSPEEQFKFKLSKWASKYLIQRNAVDELLKLLRENGHTLLPVCAKSLLKTPRSTSNLVQAIAGGQFWYRGIENGLKVAMSLVMMKEGSVTVDIFVDGLTPHKSVKRHLWPIAGCIKGEKKPFVIALWCGTSKEPTSQDEFLNDFVNEASHLVKNEFLFDGINTNFQIGNFIADAPARAWLRKVKSHNSYNSCERYDLPREWKFRRITYNPDHNGHLRTDESFAKQTNQEYHLGWSSLLLKLKINMITQFPLDIMHLVYLGVCKRLFMLLLQQKAGRFKLPLIEVQKLDRICDLIHKFRPSDFARKPRHLSDIKLFRATDFRRLLLYDGFILQRNHQHKGLWECFIFLSCAMRILLDSTKRIEYSSDAHELLVLFVKKSYSLLGPSFVVYNVHHLLHLVDDCQRHGDPENFSAFKYETNLGQLKNYLIAPGKTLQQIICRIIERSVQPWSAPEITPDKRKFFKPHAKGPMLGCKGRQFAAANLLESVIRISDESSPRDACVLTSSGEIVVVANIIENGAQVYLLGQQFLNKSDYFQYPVLSSHLNIFEVSKLGPLKKWNMKDVTQKMVYYPLCSADDDSNTYVWKEGLGLCIPLLHSEFS